MAKYNCTCIECGYKKSSDAHCNTFKCSKCGGTMRRAERPGPGQPSKQGKQMYLKELLKLEARKLSLAIKDLETRAQKVELKSRDDKIDELSTQLKSTKSELTSLQIKMEQFTEKSEIIVTPDVGDTTKKLMHLNFDLNIDEKQMELAEDGALIISGWAMKEGTWNGLFFPGEEIEKEASGLKNKQLKINHSRKIEDIVGVVLDSGWDEKRKVMTFVARLERKDIIEMVMSGKVKSVSVGVRVKETYDKEEDRYFASELEYVELSLVDIPAVKGAGITSKKVV